MDKKNLAFCERLAERRAPTFLLLGQAYLEIGAGNDIFLETILDKYGNPSPTPATSSYRDLFKTSIKDDPESARLWISERAQRLVSPVWLDFIAEYNWSGVYTSSIHSLLIRCFRKSWRAVQPLFSQYLQPLDPRSRTNLHISYLFGSLEREEEVQRTPLNAFDLTRKVPQAVSLLQRLPEQLTPLGTLVIDGYRCNDWLSPEQLFAMLMELQAGQAYLFGARDEHLNNEWLVHAVAEGRLEMFSDSFASVLKQGSEAGVISIGQRFDEEQRGRTISRGEEEVQVPDHVWVQLSRYATLLDDSLYLPLQPLSAEARYTAFRLFLAESGIQPVWNAYARGLAFEREYEILLKAKIATLLNSSTFDAEPVIVHGQTGSGKTIALGHLAVATRALKRHPVLFIGRRSQRLNHSDIDQFCQWAEEEKFPATLIIWDGMQDLDQYYLLQKYLLGRGRKFVLVGSAYRIESAPHANNLIMAPSALSSAEIPRFKEFLSSFAPSLGSNLDALLKEKDPSFLVALYRLLPDTRGQVRQGLHLEAGKAQTAIREKSDLLSPEIEPTVLALALLKAGMLEKMKVLPLEENSVAGEAISAEQELIGLIMVPGRFGLQVPIEVLLRSVHAATVTNFHQIFLGIDLFRWSEDNASNIMIGARHSLEARLIAQSRLGGPQTEMEYAKKLLSNIRSVGAGRAENGEIQFAADLVRSLGPNGPEKKLYANQYLDLANMLTIVREEHGVKNARLMLQEASLLREVVVHNIVQESNLEERLNLLVRAEVVLNDALNELGSAQRSIRLRGMLLVELASTYGTRARELLRGGKSTADILVEFSKARSAAMKARSIQPEDFFPIDVIAWSTKDLLSLADLDETTRLDIVVNLFNTLALCEGDEISVRDKELLEKRRFEFANLLNDDNLREDALRKLAEMGSPAGHYLSAIHLAGELPSADEPMNSRNLPKYGLAVEYLKNNFEQIKGDGRCVYLYLRYWWCFNSRLPFYPPERTAVPFGRAQWRDALEILETLLSLEDEFSNPQLMYLQAICRWHLGAYDDAAAIWRELERISDRVTGRRRVMKTYLASTSTGEPRKFNGTVSSISNDASRGTIYVEELLQRVAFFPRDLRVEDIQRDEQISGFHIAFNYIAPTADSEYHYLLSQKKGR